MEATPTLMSSAQEHIAAIQTLPTQTQITPQHMLLAAQQTAIAQGQVQQLHQPNAPSTPFDLSLESAGLSGAAAATSGPSQDANGHYSSLESLGPLLME